MYIKLDPQPASLPAKGQVFHSTGTEPEEYEVVRWEGRRMHYTNPMESHSRLSASADTVCANFDLGLWAHGPCPS